MSSTRIIAFPQDSRNPEDPNPTAPAAMLALPAPSAATLRAARRERHIARERYLRRKRIAALVSGITLSHRGSILALPAWVGLPAAWDTSPRQYTATITMQQRIVEMSGISTGNPNDSHAKLMAEYLAKKAAEATQPDLQLEAAHRELRELQYQKAATLTRIGSGRKVARAVAS